MNSHRLDITKMRALLRNLPTISLNNAGGTEKKTIRISDDQMAFYTAVQSAMPVGTSFSDAVAYCMEVLMLDTIDPHQEQALSPYRLFDLITQAGLFGVAINHVLEGLGIDTLPLKALGSGQRLYEHASPTQMDALWALFGVQEDFRVGNTQLPFLVRILSDPAHLSLVVRSSYDGLHPRESLIIFFCEDDKSEQCIVSQHSEYALSPTHVFHVYKTIGQCFGRKSDMLESILQHGESVGLRSFTYCVSQSDIERLSRGEFIVEMNERLPGRQSPI